MAMQADDLSSAASPLRDRLDRFQTRALRIGGIGLALCLLGGFFWPQQFFSSYLIAFLFWAGIALGCIGMTMLHHLVGGQWGAPIRRPLEAGAVTLAALAVLYLPLLLGLQRLYPWAQPGYFEHDVESLPQERLSERAVLHGPRGILFRCLDHDGVRAQPLFAYAGQVPRPGAEPMASGAQRTGASRPVPHQQLRGHRLGNVAGASMGVDHLRGDADHRRCVIHARTDDHCRGAALRRRTDAHHRHFLAIARSG